MPTTAEKTFKDISLTVEKEMKLVEDEISCINSDVQLVNDISRQILESGGKRLRPLITLLSSACFAKPTLVNIKLGAIVELIHAATLLHDDVIDNSTKRRNKPTANFIWDNKIAILSGDFVYALAFQKMTELDNKTILNILASGTSYIVEGEIIQLTQNQQATISEEDYLQVIDRKTARLFKIAAELGAVATSQNQDTVANMAQFGEKFGLAYQIINDILDYTNNEDKTGKKYGEDLTEGKPTLPFILAYEKSGVEDKKTLVDALTKNPDLETVEPIIIKTGSLKAAKQKADKFLKEAVKALEPIPRSKCKTALIELCELVSNQVAYH